MIRTNVIKTNGYFNTNRLEAANKAFEKSLAEKPRITVIRATPYPNWVEVHYLKDADQHEGKIDMIEIEVFVCECYHSLPKNNEIDMNVSAYIEGNAKEICAAYLAAGREMMQ